MGKIHFRTDNKPDLDKIINDVTYYLNENNCELSKIYIVGGYARELCDIGAYYYDGSWGDRMSEIEKTKGDVDLLVHYDPSNQLLQKNEIEIYLNDGKTTHDSIMDSKDFMLEVNFNEAPHRGSNGAVCQIFPKFNPLFNPDN